MTRIEYWTILEIIDDEIRREYTVCERIVELNKDDPNWCKQRETETTAVVSALAAVSGKIREKYGKNMTD